MYSCPLAMTDGAAFTLRHLKRESQSKKGNRYFSQELEHAFDCLTSNDPEVFWTSGQWMTEKDGGSDVNGSTATSAISVDGNKCKLYGFKWFSSATDADMSLSLARFP